MTNPQATTQTPGTDYVAQREFTTENAHHAKAIDTLRQEMTASINSTRTEFEGRIEYERMIAAQRIDYERRLTDQQIEYERQLRELEARLKNLAIDKAEASISEKTAVHNGLLAQLREERMTYVTNASMRTTVLFYVTLGGFVVLVINFILRFMGK